MSEGDLLRQIEALRESNVHLQRRTADAEQALAALAGGEVDAVMVEASATPVLLHAAQATLRRSEQLLRAVFDGTMDAMLLADDRGVYLDANQAACALFQVPRGELIGRSISEFAGPEYDAEAAYRVFQRDGQMRGVFPLLRPDGTVRTLDYSARANVVPGLHLSVLRDVTDQLAAVDGLRRSEALFRAVIEKSAEAISLTGADGKTRYLTPSAWRMLGWTREELGDRPRREQVVPEDRERIRRELERMVRTGVREMSIEFRVHRRDGSVGWVESTATNLLDDPDVAAIVGNYRDISERKQAEEALRASYEQLEAAQALAHVGSWTSGLEPDDPIHWTRECCRIFGVPDGTVITVASLFARVHPDDRAGLRGAERGAIDGGASIDFEHRVERPDGRPCWVHARAWVERPAGGGPGRMVGTVQDITERRLAADSLRASEARYRRIVETTSDGIWIYSPEGITTFMNRRMTEMLHCTVDDAVGEPVFLFMAASERARAEERMARRRQGIGDRLDFVYRCLDGAELVALVQARPMLDADGRVEAVLAVVTDVSAERRADEARAHLAALVESSEDAIFGTSLDGLITSWNRGAEKLYRYSREEAVGQSVFRLVPPSTLSEWRSGFARLVEGASIPPFETEHLRKDGSVVAVAVSVSPILNAAGKVVGFSNSARDLTSRKEIEATLRRTEDQFRQAQKMEAVGRLAGGVAHDFNNLLSVILSYADLVLAELKPGDPMRRDLGEIQSAADRATELTRQLLAFSRQQVLQPRVLDLNHVLAGMQRMLARLLGEDVELTVRAGRDLGRVLADPGQMEQVVMNLAVNARDAMPGGGQLTIETANVELDAAYAGAHLGVEVGQYVLMAITDTGTGMDGATQARIFEPFFTTKQTGKGTGLGLATAFGIVQQSGGQIGVYSELGRGTTFKIYLPRTDREADAVIASGPRAVVGGSETILLVEDEAQVRAVACAILRRSGYHVLETSNGGEALLVSRDFGAKIHLLLTDVVMPRMSGLRLVEEVSPQRPDMKILFASGYTDDAIVHHGVLDAGVPFLQKPFTPDALLRKVREVLDDPAARRP